MKWEKPHTVAEGWRRENFKLFSVVFDELLYIIPPIPDYPFFFLKKVDFFIANLDELGL
ncbi:MAG: hypothetical protein PWQ92_1678 [Thermococcaceae archaeon]|nr:hypothetical protein [Thermococcaceae archaeon]